MFVDFPVDEYPWRDLGRPEDLIKAGKDIIPRLS